MGMLRGTFTLLHGDTLVIEASQGLDETEKQLGRYKIGEGITGHVAETGRAEIVPDIRTDHRFLNRTKARNHTQPVAFICVPIFHLERVIGTLSIDRLISPEADLESDVALLEIIGNLTADAVAELWRSHEERASLLEENRKLRAMLSENPGELIGNCREMKHVYDLIRQVAPLDAAVLIRGDSGTGKEQVADAIVKLSGRKDKPFAMIHCAALPENLLESELFGHEKNAFIGAQKQHIGQIEANSEGTLYLDEVSDLSLQIQFKLLTLLQTRTFTRVGGKSILKSNVRILASTTRDLESLMRQRIFREDLYYRLTMFPILIPPLAKRKSDIILLAEHFIDKMNLKYRKNVKRLSTSAINMLMAYHWPGNVQELENGIERAVLSAHDDCIYGYDLPPSLQTGRESGGLPHPEGAADFNTLVDSYERELIVDALKNHNGNMSAAARALGISPRVIHYKIRRLKITPEWYIREPDAQG